MMKFNSLLEFTDYFKNEATCQEYFESIRFKDGEYCAHCGHGKIYRMSNARFRCAKCRKDFTIKTGTVFQKSRVSLRKWFMAIYLLSTAKKGISSVELAKKVGVTQSTAWFMDHRIREAMKKNGGQLFGTVEVDETYVGGRERNKHYSKRFKKTQGRSTLNKTPVIGLVARGGEVRATAVDDVRMRTIEKHIIENVKIGSRIYSDTFPSYNKVGKLYNHDSVNHNRRQYVKGEVHTNTIENFWATFKRGHYGTYHYMSKEHLQRYIDEFIYRFNTRSEELTDLFADLVSRVSESNPLPRKELINA
ncbi:MAG: IS1595 family transposase [Candidatus Colwellbacteria bacterium CG10_big_fil_rev_8_21_14_0_10_42_22]|uniref:IS1595 family transposase n=1 Tax=Candidatus Colwellbacteria bacterium CG10_big_fil_rev_8_21_14_0_10_42_22 TaxID=1974540 RepID=A0A2H0VG16_9BACT|nr:MAG: IS1595 family transposase [Candidatus Colwellbacteria bacterium CG10_big_fil_rev_8_21_14_0_10_42_22]